MRSMLVVAGLLLFAGACAREPAPMGRFRWETGDRTFDCIARDVDVGGVTLQSLTIQGDGVAFTSPPTGVLLGITTLELPADGETLLVTRWTAGANTYLVEVNRVVGNDVQTVLSAVTATTELGVLDVSGDGTPDIVVNERGGEGAMVPPTRRAYVWNGSSFAVLERVACAVAGRSLPLAQVRP